ncbi:YcaO-like family protein [Lysinibacillus sp. NPDC056232]|uniref:YcaO-like family protein n=1 Tax=Lysinibacillus sp. NPDC056232 TaxID=3345756 RepID=UPI0035E01933
MSNIESLCQPLSGLITPPIKLPQSPGDPEYNIYTSFLGDLNYMRLFKNRNHGNPMKIDGSGGDTLIDNARIKAMAEAVERYSSSVYSDDQFIYASANELGDEALDLDSIPLLSDEEYNHPYCPLKRPDKDKKIRWVKGISLTTQKEMYIPAIMVYLYIPYLNDDERFWLPISTGCAIHENYEKSIINSINEVIERDAISLTWLNKLELPKLEINPEVLPEWCFDYYKRTEQHPFIQTYYFDATTDLGISSIYSLQVSKYNEKLTSMVMCTTELDPLIAFSKITREGASARIALQNRTLKGNDFNQFYEVMDGALYMGQASNASSFNFLKQSESTSKLSEMKNLSTGSDQADLKKLISILKKKGHEIFAVDLTTDEAKRAGLKATRVIIPSLQPLSFAYRAQFKGTSRLFQAPVNMGYKIRTEDQLNKNPQPFA